MLSLSEKMMHVALAYENVHTVETVDTILSDHSYSGLIACIMSA